MTTINALIIAEANDVTKKIKKFEEENFMILKIVSNTTSIIKGINSIKTHKPDLVFLSISFKEDTFFKKFSQLEQNLPKLIFISDHKEDALIAFKQDAIDFILKPFECNDLIFSVYKAIKQIKMERSYQNQKINTIETLNSSSMRNDFVAVSSLDNIELIPMKDIMYCQADGKYTAFFLLNGKKVVSSKNLKEYNSILDSNLFFRIHHSHTINLHHVVKILKKDGYYCELPNGIFLPVAKRRQEDFHKFIKIKD
jgi:two-component system LytT family response regulator